jgi:hypothetical protein
MGTTEIMYLPPAEAKAYYLSYGGEGVSEIRASLDGLEQRMAFLGARMLQPEKRGIESAETARIHRMGEVSILATLTNSASQQLTEAMAFMLAWATVEDEASIKLNDDFLPASADPTLVRAMVASWQVRGISHDTLWRFFQVGELVDPRRTLEEELELIEDEKPDEPPPEPEAPAPLPPFALTAPPDELPIPDDEDT